MCTILPKSRAYQRLPDTIMTLQGLPKFTMRLRNNLNNFCFVFEKTIENQLLNRFKLNLNIRHMLQISYKHVLYSIPAISVEKN